MKGLSNTGDSPTGFQKQLEGSKDEKIDLGEWMLDVVQYLYLVYVLAAVGIIWFVVSMLFCFAMCCPGCRRCYGKCFCQKCCLDRLDRVAPMQRVEKHKITWFKVCGIIAIVLIFVISILGISLTALISRDAEVIQCVPFSLTYELMNGTLRAADPWRGIVYVEGSLNTMKTFYAPAEDAAPGDSTNELDCENYANDETWAECVRAVSIGLENSADTLNDAAETLSHVAVNTYNAFKTDYPWGEPPVSVSVAHRCVFCEIVKEGYDEVEYEALNEAVDAVKDEADKNTGSESSLADLAGNIDDALDQWADSEEGISDLLDTVMDFEKTVDDLPDWIMLLAWLLPVLLFLFALLGFLYGMILLIILWLHYDRDTEPPAKKMRNNFGFLWMWFAFYGCVMFAAACVFLAATQVGSEPCTTVNYEFLANAEFDKYERTESLHNNSLIEHCGIDGGTGDLIQALDMEENYMDFQQSMDELDKDLSVYFEAVRDLHKELQSDWGNSAVAAAADEIYIMQTVDEEGVPLPAVATFWEAICGSPHQTEEKSPTDELVKAKLKEHVENATAALKLLSGSGMHDNTLTGEVDGKETCDEVYSLAALAGRMNGVLSEKHCECDGYTSVCFGDYCATDVYVIDHETYHPSCGPDSEPVNRTVSCMYDCISDGDGAETENGTRAIQFGNAVHLGAQRCRVRMIEGLFRDGADDDVEYEEIHEKLSGWVVAFNEAFTNFDEETEESDETMTKQINVAQTYIDDQFQDEYNCHVVNHLTHDVVDAACYDLVGSYLIASICLFIASIGYFIGHVLSWKQYHYWRDRRAAEKAALEEAEDEDLEKELEDVVADVPPHISEVLRATKDQDEKRLARALVYYDPRLVTDCHGNTALHYAAEIGDERITKMLLNNRADPNQSNKYGYTPVHVACSERHPVVLEMLIAKGGDVDRNDEFGETLMLAVTRADDSEMLDVLMTANADPTTADRRADTPHSVAVKLGHLEASEKLRDYEEAFVKSSPARPTPRSP